MEEWSNDEQLSKEFESVGFYLSDHPLNNYKDILKIQNTTSFKDFIENDEKDAFLAGTIMKIQEKKTSKGNSYAIIKFSDLSKVFELFIFSEVLEKTRKDLIEGQSYIITVIKDKSNKENRLRRITVKSILSIKELTNKSFENVYIEIDKSDNLKILSNVINEKGNSKIKIFVNEPEKQYLFELKNKRKFDYKILKYLNKEHYIKKIRV